MTKLPLITSTISGAPMLVAKKGSSDDFLVLPFISDSFGCCIVRKFKHYDIDGFELILTDSGWKRNEDMSGRLMMSLR